MYVPEICYLSYASITLRISCSSPCRLRRSCGYQCVARISVLFIELCLNTLFTVLFRSLQILGIDTERASLDIQEEKLKYSCIEKL